jgi:hypothetical protein
VSEQLDYWARLGFEPTVAFELRDGRLGYAHRRDERENGYVRFVAAVVFEKHGPQALSIFEVPNDLILRIEPFSPKKSETFGDFLRALKEGLFGGEKR